MRIQLVSVAVAALATLALSGSRWTPETLASDHDEAPLVKEDAAMDLTDLYVFESGTDKTTIIACWAGFNDSRAQPDTEALYDVDALYTINIDNDGDNVPDHQIYWRYGTNDRGEIGVRWENVPGTDGNVAGPVESVFDAGDGARVWSGHADDPFFFDAGGYLLTLDTGTLNFDSEDDFLEGFNVTAAAIEIDNALIRSGTESMQFWITASRAN